MGINKRCFRLAGANFCKELLLRNCGVLIYIGGGTTGIMFCYQTDVFISGGGGGGGF